jgi:hypothetical protein
MGDISNNITCDMLQRRKMFFSILSPGPRNTLISPYPNFSQAQLDMRRKVEILQYKKNSTQSTQPTKAERYASIVKGSYRENSNKICDKDLLKPTPTSASNIPGPPMILQYDPTVELYNYQTNRVMNTYDSQVTNLQVKLNENIISTTLVTPVQQINNGNVFITAYSVPETVILSLIIPNANNITNSFNFGIPIGIYVSGSNNCTQSIDVEFYLINARLNVYYYPNSSYYYTTDSSKSLFVNDNLLSSQIQLNDISGSFVVHGKSNVNSPPINFEGTQYFANLNIPNIVLNINNGDVYNFNLSYNIYTVVNVKDIMTGNTITGNTIISNFNAGIYTNVSTTTTAVNCTFTSQPSIVVNNYRSYYFNTNII